MSLGNCKLKQQEITTNLLEWLKSKMWTTPNTDKDVGQQNSYSLQVGMQNVYHFAKQFGSLLQN